MRPSTDQIVYFATVLLTVGATGALTMPAAYHRIRFRQGDKERMLRLSNTFAIVGLALLTVAMATVVFLITNVLYGVGAAIPVSLVVLVVLGFSWFAIPVFRRVEDELSRSSAGPDSRLQSADRLERGAIVLLVDAGSASGCRVSEGSVPGRVIPDRRTNPPVRRRAAADRAGHDAGGDRARPTVEREDPHDDAEGRPRGPDDEADDSLLFKRGSKPCRPRSGHRGEGPGPPARRSGRARTTQEADASGADQQPDDDQHDAGQDAAADDADDPHDHQHDGQDPEQGGCAT